MNNFVVKRTKRKRDQNTTVSIDLGTYASVIQTLGDALSDWGWHPFPTPTPGFRYKLRAEYAIEYQDSGTTAARRQQLLAIRCGLLPQETVAVQS